MYADVRCVWVCLPICESSTVRFSSHPYGAGGDEHWNGGFTVLLQHLVDRSSSIFYIYTETKRRLHGLTQQLNSDRETKLNELGSRIRGSVERFVANKRACISCGENWREFRRLQVPELRYVECSLQRCPWPPCRKCAHGCREFHKLNLFPGFDVTGFA